MGTYFDFAGARLGKPLRSAGSTNPRLR